MTQPAVAEPLSEDLASAGEAPITAAPRARRPRRKSKKPTCEDCFFFQHKLCALDQSKPCPTFREAHPDGLRPPRQLSFAFRTERPSLGLFEPQMLADR